MALINVEQARMISSNIGDEHVDKLVSRTLLDLDSRIITQAKKGRELKWIYTDELRENSNALNRVLHNLTGRGFSVVNMSSFGLVLIRW